MEVDLRCQLKSFRPDRGRFGRLANLVVKDLKLKFDRVSLWVTVDPTMRRINKQHRKKNHTTDVLSFPAAPHPQLKDQPAFFGDVVISLDRAKKQARDEGHSLITELDWLWLHGLLHLSGYDHQTDQGQMTSLEYRLRLAWEKIS